MFRDIRNPFSPPPQSPVRFGDTEFKEIYLELLARFANDWLDRIEKSGTPLAAAFNRACRGNSMLQILSSEEASLGIEFKPQASPEQRLIAVATAAGQQGLTLDGWDKLLPRLKAVSEALTAESGSGAWHGAKAARAALRGIKPA